VNTCIFTDHRSIGTDGVEIGPALSCVVVRWRGAFFERLMLDYLPDFLVGAVDLGLVEQDVLVGYCGEEVSEFSGQ